MYLLDTVSWSRSLLQFYHYHQKLTHTLKYRERKRGDGLLSCGFALISEQKKSEETEEDLPLACLAFHHQAILVIEIAIKYGWPVIPLKGHVRKILHS